MKKLLTTLLVFFLYTATPISAACVVAGNCGLVLDNNCYTVPASITNRTSDCFTIRSNVVLSCSNGVWVNKTIGTTSARFMFNTTSTGLNRVSNVTVANCGLGNWNGSATQGAVVDFPVSAFTFNFTNNTVVSANPWSLQRAAVLVTGGNVSYFYGNRFSNYRNALNLTSHYFSITNNNSFLNGSDINISMVNNGTTYSNHTVFYNQFSDSFFAFSTGTTADGLIEFFRNNVSNTGPFVRAGSIGVDAGTNVNTPTDFIFRDNLQEGRQFGFFDPVGGATIDPPVCVDLAVNNTRAWNNTLTRCTVAFRGQLAAQTNVSWIIFNNTFDSTVNYSVQLANSLNVTSHGNYHFNTTNHTGYLYFLNGSKNLFIINDTVDLNTNATPVSAGVAIIGSTGFASTNVTILNFTNVNKTRLHVAGARGTPTSGISWMRVQEFVRVNLTSKTNAPISGGSANFFNRLPLPKTFLMLNDSGLLAYNLSTDGSGLTAWQAVDEIYLNGTCTIAGILQRCYNTTDPCVTGDVIQRNWTCYQPFKFDAFASRYVSNSTNSTMNRSQTVTLLLDAVPTRKVRVYSTNENNCRYN